MRWRGMSRLVLGAVLLGSCLAIGPADAAIFTVDSTGDGADSAPGNGTCRAPGNVCTLRAAIQEANALAGADLINFNIAPAGAKTIVLGSALPAITSVVIIDGTTQQGFGVTPIIELNAASGGANTLSLQSGSSGSTIRGLVINRAPGRAIRLLGTSTSSSKTSWERTWRALRRDRATRSASTSAGSRTTTASEAPSTANATSSRATPSTASRSTARAAGPRTPSSRTTTSAWT